MAQKRVKANLPDSKEIEKKPPTAKELANAEDQIKKIIEKGRLL